MKSILSYHFLFLWVSGRSVAVNSFLLKAERVNLPAAAAAAAAAGRQLGISRMSEANDVTVSDGTSLESDNDADNAELLLTTMPEEDFLVKIRSSIDTNTTLDLTGYQVTLTNRGIRLRGKEHLEIHGGLIQGQTHSLFQIDGDKKNSPRRLTLRHTCLKHSKVHEDPREIGAAVFAMGSSVVELEDCDISSKGGFAVWAKHRCTVNIKDCRIHDVARTAVACFNSCQVTVQDTSMVNVGIHGICGRGMAVMTLNNVQLDRCQTRAVMAYQGATMQLENCTIDNTLDPLTPAVHAQGPSAADLAEAAEKAVTSTAAETKSKGTPSKKFGPDDYKLMIPTLNMTRCKVTNSAGPPFLAEGTVTENLSDNEIIS